MAQAETITRREILLESIRLAGALEATGTADAGGAATLDDGLLIHPNTDQLLGHNIYILDGTAQGSDRIVTAFTPGSDRVTVVPNWSATVDSTSVYVILKRPWRIQAFIEGVNAAIRTARVEGILAPKVNYELIGQDILFGQGNFARWAAGTTSAPSGWTLSGGSSTIARRTENPKTYLPYQPRVTSDNTNASLLSLSITNFAAYRGENLSLRGFIRTDVASRVTIDVTDGVTTQTSTAISASGDLNEWRDSEETDGPAVTDFTVNDNPTELTVNLRSSAGTTVNADFAGVRLLLLSRSLTEFDIPQGSEDNQYRYVNRITLGHGLTDDFIPYRELEQTMRKPQPFRIVDRELTRRLLFTTPPPTDQPIRIEGQASQDIITSDDTNVQMNATFLAVYAAWYAAGGLPRGHEAHAMKVGWERGWDRMMRSMDRGPKAGSLLVYGW